MNLPKGKRPLSFLQGRVRPLILGGLVAFIIAEVVVLSPSQLEQSAPATIATQERLTDSGILTIAPGIPKNRMPEYSIDQFKFVATHSGEKEWKIVADKAFLYNRERLVHSRIVTAYLFDPEGKITVVTGKEAKYFMNQRDLEVFGDVITTFPDGFRTHSEYLHYLPNRRMIDIPVNYAVDGGGKQSDAQDIQFKSLGMEFEMGKSEIILPKAVVLTMLKASGLASPTPQSTGLAVPNTAPSPLVTEATTIESDRCVIHRDTQIANFTMNLKHPLKTRFVKITQPTLHARSRRAELSYGNFNQVLQYLTAYEDVLIQEVGTGSSLRYGTGGKADFDSRRNVVVLKEYPQVYQDNDTVTGDVIVVHRDSDIVEVEHSNAFSQGEQPKPVQQPK